LDLAKFEALHSVTSRISAEIGQRQKPDGAKERTSGIRQRSKSTEISLCDMIKEKLDNKSQIGQSASSISSYSVIKRLVVDPQQVSGVLSDMGDSSIPLLCSVSPRKHQVLESNGPPVIFTDPFIANVLTSKSLSPIASFPRKENRNLISVNQLENTNLISVGAQNISQNGWLTVAHQEYISWDAL